MSEECWHQVSVTSADGNQSTNIGAQSQQFVHQPGNHGNQSCSIFHHIQVYRLYIYYTQASDSKLGILMDIHKYVTKNKTKKALEVFKYSYLSFLKKCPCRSSVYQILSIDRKI